MRDSLLLKKGLRAYPVAELQKHITAIDLGKLPHLTLEELRWKVRATPEGTMPAPLFFQQNVGQSKSAYEYVVQTSSFTAGLTADAICAVVVKDSTRSERDKLDSQQEKQAKGQSSPGNMIVLRFRGAKSGKLTGRSPLEGVVNSVTGRDSKLWHHKIPSYRYVANDQLYDGISLIAKPSSGRLEYSLVVSPKARVDSIRISTEGCEPLYLDREGNLVLPTSGGPIVQTRPRFYDIFGGERRQIAGRFVIVSPSEYGFEVSNHNPIATLLIDPQIVFATYFGGTGQEGMLGADDGAADMIGRGFDIHVGSDGSIFLVGRTSSADLPVTNAGAINGDMDIFVLKIDINFQIAYATYIGGSDQDRGRAITASEDGTAYVTGFSFSSDLPTCPVVSPCGVLSETGPGAYVIRLAPDGTFGRGTFVGARPGRNHPNSIRYERQAAQTEGSVYIAGASEGASDATAGSMQAVFAGGEDGFVAKLDTELGGLQYFTYLGGSGLDAIMDLDVRDGYAFVCGMTASTDFPTTDEPHLAQLSDQSNPACTGGIGTRECADGFVSRIDQSGGALIYSTYFGEEGEESFARGIAVDSGKEAYMTGASRPVATTSDDTTITVAKFSVHGDLIWETTMPGLGRDHGEEIVVDQFDRAHVTGTISLEGLEHGNPTPLPFHGGTSDIFYARFGPNGENDYFTYLGGSGRDRGFAIAAAGGSIEEFCSTIVGSTVSDDVNTVNELANGNARQGNSDVLIFRLCDSPFTPPCLTLSKTASGVGLPPSAPVPVGGQIRFDIVVTNNCDVAGSVIVSDIVPSCITNVTANTSADSPSFNNHGNSIMCTFMAQPGPSILSITGTVSNACCGAVIRNTARLDVFNRLVAERSSLTAVGGCPTPPPPQAVCGNGICESSLGETCDDCDDCMRFLDVEAPCYYLGECEACPPGTSCRQEFLGVVVCDWHCSVPVLDLFHCDNCGDGIYSAAKCMEN